MYEKYIEYFKVHSVNSRYFRIDCPLCKGSDGRGDTKGHMHLFRDSWIGQCFRCGGRKHIRSLLVLIGITPPKETLQTSQAFVSLVNRIKNPTFPVLEEPSEIELPEGSIFIGDIPNHRLFSRVFNQLDKWKLTMNTARSMQFHWNPAMDSFIFPCYMSGRLVFYTSRTISGHRSAYKGEMSKYGILYNYDSELADSVDKVYIVEGPKDSAACYQNGIWAIALMGHHLNSAQHSRLESLRQQKILFLDSDVFHSSRKMEKQYGWETIYLKSGDPADWIDDLGTALNGSSLSSKVYQYFNNPRKS